jgi:uncharacterized membrane protein YedE/YeeE
MENTHMKLVSSLVAGAVFGLGIAISGMANPAKVLNFFDIAGTFDPSLAIVMASALLTAMAGYAIVLKRPAPVFEAKFDLPTSKQIDTPLIAGSAVFGIGWGISGFCPGGAIPALGYGRWEAFAFVAAMIVGLKAAEAFRNYRANRLRTA